MKKRRQTFSAEFKREAVSLVDDQGYSFAEAGRSLGIRGNLIGRWKRQLEADEVDAFPGNGKLTPDQQRESGAGSGGPAPFWWTVWQSIARERT